MYHDRRLTDVNYGSWSESLRMKLGDRVLESYRRYKLRHELSIKVSRALA